MVSEAWFSNIFMILSVLSLVSAVIEALIRPIVRFTSHLRQSVHHMFRMHPMTLTVQTGVAGAAATEAYATATGDTGMKAAVMAAVETDKEKEEGEQGEGDKIATWNTASSEFSSIPGHSGAGTGARESHSWKSVTLRDASICPGNLTVTHGGVVQAPYTHSHMLGANRVEVVYAIQPSITYSGYSLPVYSGAQTQAQAPVEWRGGLPPQADLTCMYPPMYPMP